jgi:hypothetical protein
VGARIEAHVTDVLGQATCDLAGPHVGRGLGGCLRPFARRIARLGQARMLHHDDEREVVSELRSAGDPGAFRDPAYAHAARVHEVGTALDVDGTAFEIVGHRRLGRGRRSFGEF